MNGSLPGAVARPAESRFALLAVDGVEYAVESTRVRRTLPAPRPLPAAIPHGGAAFAVIDLRQLFGLAPAAHEAAAAGDIAGDGRERLVLLVEGAPGATPAGGAACRLALVVDELVGLESLAAAAAVPLPAVYRGPERRWFKGLLPRAGGRITVLLDLEGLAPLADRAAAGRWPGAGGC
jgi:chemotaxis signal transduction protein